MEQAGSETVTRIHPNASVGKHEDARSARYRWRRALGTDRSLSPAARLTGLMLEQLWGGPDFGPVYPSIETIAEALGQSRASIKRHIATLRDAGFIEVKNRRRGGNVYTFVPQPDEEKGSAVIPFRREKGLADDPISENMGSSVAVMGSSVRNYGLTGEPRSIEEPEEEPLPPVAPPSPKAERKHALPDGWRPSDRNLSDAERIGLSKERANDEAQRFADHHGAHGNRFIDWDKAWRNWCRKALDFDRRNMAGGAAPGRGRSGSSLAAQAARNRARDGG